MPIEFPSKILVPFSVESPLSGIEKKVEADDFLIYRKKFSCPEGFHVGKRVLIHFDAVDQVADVRVNGDEVIHHEGGYLPFRVEFRLQEENEIVLIAQDDTDSPIYPRGKQSNHPGGIWYHPTSGIWGDVWMEEIPEEAIESIRLTPDFDEKQIHVSLAFEGGIHSSSVEILWDGRVVARGQLDQEGNASISLEHCFHPWSPEEPALYQARVSVNEDSASSCFAMRKFSRGEKNGHPVFYLNNEPLLLKAVLDQGYFPDGGLTAPSVKAMENDIVLMKEMGFNCLRKHIKIEPPRWYYLAAKRGMLVIQDFVNNGSAYRKGLINLAPFIHFRFTDTKAKDHKRFGQGKEESRAFFENQIPLYVNHLWNMPSLCVYVLFNEGWGQFDAVRLTGKLKELDGTRLIDSNCGWFDQHSGDFCGDHIYFRKIKMKGDGVRVLSLSEFGGYAWRIEGHAYAPKSFGYRGYKSKEALEKGISDLFEKQLAPEAKAKGISCYVYTQLSDVEEEVNGLVSYDREVVKVTPSLMKKLNDEVDF